MAAEELQAPETSHPLRRHPKKKRKLKNGKFNKHGKASAEPSKKHKKPTQRMQKIFRKRTRDYHSDSEDDAEETAPAEKRLDSKPFDARDDDEESDLDAMDDLGSSDDERDGDGGGAHHQGITKFTEGCRAFKVAFKKIMKKHLPNDPLGPILSAHKKLVAEKLAEEVLEQKAKGEAKKEKGLAGEKGRVKPVSVLDSKEKQLIRIATKGVVKLFNAVNNAQNSVNGLNPSKSKDAKVLAKRRKQAFLSEIQKPNADALTNSSLHNSSKSASASGEGNDEPGWAPLRDSYMLTNSKLKDWDKMADPASVVDSGIAPVASSSDEE